VGGVGKKHERERERERRNSHRILVGKPEERRPLCRPRCRWEDGIKICIEE